MQCFPNIIENTFSSPLCRGANPADEQPLSFRNKVAPMIPRRSFTAATIGLSFCLALAARAQSLTGATNSLIKLTNDPYCGPSNLLSVVHIAPRQSDGTRRMVDRLAQFNQNANPRLNILLSDRFVPLIEKELPKATNLQQKLNLTFQLANELLNAGQTEMALQRFDDLEKLATEAGINQRGKNWNQARFRRGIGLLRLGEQQNCMMNHNSESCLFPIQPAGYHKIARGSRGAIAVFADQLSIVPSDLSSRWLLNIAYMTLGEYPDKVPPQWLIPPSCFKSEYEMPKFPDIAGNVGLDTENRAGGCILDDFDNDGFIDVVSSSSAMDGQLRYFHNDGNGRFSERTIEAGLLGIVGGLNIQQTDYNNDGFPDIWVMRGGWLGTEGRIPKSLLRNNGDGTFSDVTEEVGLLSLHPSQTSVWFDYDGDGWLDLFIGNETTNPNDPEPCELFHNNGNGTFTECGAQCGLNVKRYVKGVACGDYDNDGRPDLYLSCREGGGLLFHNDGPASASGATISSTHWQFTDATAKAGLGPPVHSFPTWFFDYDNDGYEDLFVSGYQVKNVGDVAADYLGLPHRGDLPKLFHNNRDGTFTDVTAAANLSRLCVAMGANFGDLDNDGWLDFYLGTGDPDFATLIPNRMFRNAGGKSFQEVTAAGGFGHLQKGHGVAFADLDNDGDQDIYIVVGGALAGDSYRNALFLNPGNTNHWIKLKMEGVKCNRAAIGTRLKVTVATPSGPRNIYKTVNSGGSFGASPLRQEIGLGDATAITALEVLWPASGLRQKFSNLSLDSAYRIREGASQAAAIDLKQIHFSSTPVTSSLHVMGAGGH
jgi:hypothetical protein